MLIRRAAANEALVAADLYLASRAGAGALIPPSVHDYQDVRRWMRVDFFPRAEIWFAVDEDDAPLAILSLEGDDWLEQLDVLPRRRGRGSGEPSSSTRNATVPPGCSSGPSSPTPRPARSTRRTDSSRSSSPTAPATRNARPTCVTSGRPSLESMPVYRDHPRRGSALVAHVTYVAACSLVGGSGAVFLLIVIAAVVGEESLGVLYGDGLDPIMRVSVGVIALLLTLAGAVAIVALSARRLATARQLAADAEREPGSIATWADRRDIEVGNPFWPLYIYAIYFVIIDVIALIVFALALPETIKYNPESAADTMPIVVLTAALGLLVVLLVVYARWVATSQWRTSADRAKTIWNEDLRADATRAERDARRETRTVDFGTAHRILFRARKWFRLGVVFSGVIGVVLFFLGVWLRKPCRTASERYFDPPIERLIDVVVVIGGPLIVLSAAIGIRGAGRPVDRARHRDGHASTPGRGGSAVAHRQATAPASRRPGAGRAARHRAHRRVVAAHRAVRGGALDRWLPGPRKRHPSPDHRRPARGRRARLVGQRRRRGAQSAARGMVARRPGAAHARRR